MDHSAFCLAFFDIGATELLVILFIGLMLFGGERLPSLARGLGKSIREFKKATAGIEEELKRAMAEPAAQPKPKPAVPAALAPPPPTEVGRN